jgi:hypothetical protein
MKILCFVNHYYGQTYSFSGGSSSSTEDKAEKRKSYVLNTINQLKQNKYDIEVCVCGISSNSLINIDQKFDHIIDKPIQLIYESLNFFIKYLNNYDYFLNIEDDLIVPEDSLERLLYLDKEIHKSTVIIPNRMEHDLSGKEFCVDMYAIPHWRNRSLQIDNKIYKEAENPHSGFLFLSKEKLALSFSSIDLNFRGITIGKELESAFAHFHSPFTLYRPFNPLDSIKIIHQDKYKHSPNYLSDKFPYYPFGYKTKLMYDIEKYTPNSLIYYSTKVLKKISDKYNEK